MSRTAKSILLLVAGGAMVITQACQSKSHEPKLHEVEPTTQPTRVVSAAIDPLSDTARESREAFLAAYTVLMHPRCMNCHPAGDQPLQGEDSHIHTQNVQRGPDGKGLFAMKCANCHQPKNVPGQHTPPGNPKWRLPSASMPLVFQGRSPYQLALQLKDSRQNVGKTLEQILEHVAHDDLVAAGWDPGEGRSKPPMSQAQFAAKMREWVEKGAFPPQ